LPLVEEGLPPLNRYPYLCVRERYTGNEGDACLDAEAEEV
jgi:hypothetical protein